MQPLFYSAALAVGSLALPAAADFVLVDDFESYAPNASLPPQNGYSTTNGGSAAIVVADSDGADQAVSIAAGTDVTELSKNAFTIAEGTTGTVFNQLRFEGNDAPNYVQGYGSGVDFFGSSFAFKAQFGGGGTFGILAGNDVDTGSQLIADATYNIFAVIDNAVGTSDAFRLYIQSDDDANYATLTQVGAGLTFTKSFGGQPLAGDYTSLVFSSFDDVTPTIVDNYYVDTMGENLVNPIPIPEPGAIGVLGLATAGLLAKRR